MDAENYLLICHRYIELNPVAANMVESPQDYRWSSYKANALGEYDKLISPHELYMSLGECDIERQRCYRELFQVMVSEIDIHSIRNTTNKSYPIGGEKFKQQVEVVLGRKSSNGEKGRPKKHD